MADSGSTSALPELIIMFQQQMNAQQEQHQQQMNSQQEQHRQQMEAMMALLAVKSTTSVT